jgi:hypothetical protein
VGYLRLFDTAEAVLFDDAQISIQPTLNGWVV